MTTDAQKNELLEDFRNYLEQSRLEPFTAQEQPDLHTLLSEMAGLKAEVKAESRQFKSALDTLSSALATVQEDNRALAAELAVHAERMEQQQRQIMRTVLLDIVEIYDRLAAGLEALQNYRPVSSLFKHSRDQDVRFIKHFREGQAMTVRRFEQLLRQYQVRPIDCVGQLFDPVTMSAIDTGYDPKLENGIVLEELRKGFLLQDQVLRLAEVKVNKNQR
ncbi:nucleotide exchange factor GrpE [Methylobacter sp. sgz302048]|uniref:nucleotide exchange factor GrpE n=1 Tax=Methylobacter sp. sgz302048 TaxID=3455945 RepID=UPI003FA05F65